MSIAVADMTLELAFDLSKSRGLAAAGLERHVKLFCGLAGWPRVGAEVVCFLAVSEKAYDYNAVVAQHVTENFELGCKLSEMTKWYGMRDECSKVLNFALYDERARQQCIHLLLLATFITLADVHFSRL